MSVIGKQRWIISLQSLRRSRGRVLFNLSIDSKLDGCDVVRVHIGDVVSGGRFRDRGEIVQQNTRRPAQFAFPESGRLFTATATQSMVPSLRAAALVC